MKHISEINLDSELGKYQDTRHCLMFMGMASPIISNFVLNIDETVTMNELREHIIKHHEDDINELILDNVNKIRLKKHFKLMGNTLEHKTPSEFTRTKPVPPVTEHVQAMFYTLEAYLSMSYLFKDGTVAPETISSLTRYFVNRTLSDKPSDMSPLLKWYDDDQVDYSSSTSASFQVCFLLYRMIGEWHENQYKVDYHGTLKQLLARPMQLAAVTYMTTALLDLQAQLKDFRNASDAVDWSPEDIGMVAGNMLADIVPSYVATCTTLLNYVVEILNYLSTLEIQKIQVYCSKEYCETGGYECEHKEYMTLLTKDRMLQIPYELNTSNNICVWRGERHSDFVVINNSDNDIDTNEPIEPEFITSKKIYYQTTEKMSAWCRRDDNGKLLFDVPDDKKSNTDIKESLGHFADVIENLDSVDNLSTSKYDNPDTPHIQTLAINVQFTPEEYE